MDLHRYKEFAEKVSRAFSEIHKKHPQDFQCKIGCHQCCQPGLTVNALERASIENFLRENPERIEEIRNAAKQNFYKGKRCNFLAPEGACMIYEARPIVCRSHGAPLQFRNPEAKNPDKAERYRDVCPLNFTSGTISELSPADILNLDTINTLLSLLLQQSASQNLQHQRYPLQLESIL